MEIASVAELFVVVKKDVEEARKVVEELGFQPIQVSENTITFRLKRKGNN